jgi:hypothetical protein
MVFRAGGVRACSLLRSARRSCSAVSAEELLLPGGEWLGVLAAGVASGVPLPCRRTVAGGCQCSMLLDWVTS